MTKTRHMPRQGSLLVCVLVCLLVASALVASTTHSALMSRRDVRVQHQLRQTELLLDAGVLRATRRLQASQDYQGELWQPVAAIDRFDNAQVEIRITEQGVDSRLVEVIASLGVAVDDVKNNGASLTRRTHTFGIKLSESTTTSDSPSAE